jgi:membrane fusion protein (multidrug efflux system)
VLGGIEPGEKIVVDGVQTLHEGSEITTSNKQAPAQKGKDSSNK